MAVPRPVSGSTANRPKLRPVVRPVRNSAGRRPYLPDCTSPSATMGTTPSLLPNTSADVSVRVSKTTAWMTRCSGRMGGSAIRVDRRISRRSASIQDRSRMSMSRVSIRRAPPAPAGRTSRKTLPSLVSVKATAWPSDAMVTWAMAGPLAYSNRGVGEGDVGDAGGGVGSSARAAPARARAAALSISLQYRDAIRTRTPIPSARGGHIAETRHLSVSRALRRARATLKLWTILRPSGTVRRLPRLG